LRHHNHFGSETYGFGLPGNQDLAVWHFGHGCLQHAKDALVLMTDGISEDLHTTEGFVAALVHSLRSRGARSAQAMLTQELINWPTPRHGDDKTLAIIYRSEKRGRA
jgi:serine/threonine protein phosphatase PrpC